MKIRRIKKKKMAIRAVMILLAVAGMSVPCRGWCQVAEAQPENKAATVDRIDYPELPAADPMPLDWNEDPARLRRKLERQMTPKEYRKALKTTGMQEALQAVFKTTGSQEALQADLTTEESTWVRTGPIGNFVGQTHNGRISAVQIYPHATDHRIYVGACQGGLWKSTLSTLGDWTSIGDALESPSTGTFAVNPSSALHILVGTGDWARSSGGGLFMSDDGGATWSHVQLPVDTPDYFTALKFHPSNPRIVLAASSKGLLRSTDWGVSWSVVLAHQCTDLAIHPTNHSVMYACQMWPFSDIDRGIFKSTDAGVTWTLLTDTDLPTGDSWDRASVAICRDNPDVLAVIVENDGDFQGVYRSTDAGANWDDISGDLRAASWASQIWHAQAIAFRPNNPNQIYVGSVKIARTDDAGANWEVGESDSGIDQGHADITQLYFNDLTGDDVLWICNDGGIYKHSIGGGTVSAIGGSSGLSVSEIDYMDADRDMRVIGLQDNGIVQRIGAGSWLSIDTGDGTDVEIVDAESASFWFVNGAYSDTPHWRIYKKAANNAITYTFNPDLYRPGLFYDSFNDRMITMMQQSNILSKAEGSPAGESWEEIITDVGPTNEHRMRHLVGSKVDGKTLYVLFWEDGGHEADLSIIHNSGASWQTYFFENLNPSGDYILTASPSAEWPGECWVGFRGKPGDPKIYHTTDFGQHWQDVTGNLADLNGVNTIVATPFDSETLFAGTDIGVFRTTDGGQSWAPFQDGLPIAICKEIRFVVDDEMSAGHKLVLATDGRGTYERTISTSPIVYVDKNYMGTEDGSLEHPYNTVSEGVAAAPAGSIIAVRSNEYVEPQTLTKQVKIVTWAGKTTIR